MLVVRFLRAGKKNQPSFKIVVTDKRNPPKGGRFLEQVGFYNPLTKEKVLKTDRIKYWLSVGAKPSDTVHNLLISEKILEGKKIPAHKTKKPSEALAMEGKEEVKPVSDKLPEEAAKQEEKDPQKEEKVEEEGGEKPVQEKPIEEAKKKGQKAVEAEKEGKPEKE